MKCLIWLSSKDFMHSTTGLSPTSTASLTVPVLNESTSNIPEISTAAPTKIIPTITEEVKVHEKINKEEVVAQEKSLQEMTTSKTFISVSTESYIHSDILAGIENQIITETESKQTPIWIKSTIRSNRVELSKPVATDVMVKDIEHSVKNTDTKSPDFSTTATTVESNTVVRNEDLHPENIHPEPISPRVPSHIDNHMNIPTTPAQSFHTIEETVKVSAEINPINDGAKTDPVSENGMNVYFDTGSSKNSPFEMNNDTYIIVVGAIVGLVVLAVVIGILCHNSRKTRSEKVNISGEVDPTSHQNQVFDSEAADAEQGASSNGVVRDSSIPVENGGSNDTSEKEHNGNVES